MGAIAFSEEKVRGTLTFTNNQESEILSNNKMSLYSHQIENYRAPGLSWVSSKQPVDRDLCTDGFVWSRG